LVTGKNVGSELQAGYNTSLILSPAASLYPHEEETDRNPIVIGWSIKKETAKLSCISNDF